MSLDNILNAAKRVAGEVVGKGRDILTDDRTKEAAKKTASGLGKAASWAGEKVADGWARQDGDEAWKKRKRSKERLRRNSEKASERAKKDFRSIKHAVIDLEIELDEALPGIKKRKLIAKLEEMPNMYDDVVESISAMNDRGAAKKLAQELKLIEDKINDLAVLYGVSL